METLLIEDDPFVDAPAADQIAAMGFTEAELELLREAGLYHPQVNEPWAPTTLEDVDWVCWTALEMDREIEAIEARATARVKRLEAARKLFVDRYASSCQEIVAANLPRKNGKVVRKSLDLDRVKVGLRASAGGPKVTDEAALLEHIRDAARAALDGELIAEAVVRSPELTAMADALRAVVTYSSVAAFERLAYGCPAKYSVLATPIKQFVASLPGVPDPVTGEVRPATIPGVEIVPPSETFHFE